MTRFGSIARGLLLGGRRLASASVRSARALPMVAVVSLTACASSRGSFDDGIYRKGPIAFQLGAVPATWRSIEVTGASLAFRDDANEGSVLINARCSKVDSDTPLTALTNHLLMGSTERNVLRQETEPFDRREALHTTVQAKWDGVPTALDIFVLNKDGCTYDFVYTAPPSLLEKGTEAFDGFVRTFRTLPGSGVVR